MWPIELLQRRSVREEARYPGVVISLDEAHQWVSSHRNTPSPLLASWRRREGSTSNREAYARIGETRAEDVYDGEERQHFKIDSDEESDSEPDHQPTTPSSQVLDEDTRLQSSEYSIDRLRYEVRNPVKNESSSSSPTATTVGTGAAESLTGRGGQGQLHTEYDLKARLINKALQDIGMGTYNWQIFMLSGMGWMADNLWMQGISLTLPSLSQEFKLAETTVRYTTSCLFLGLCFGSYTWGIGSDVFGRRIAFNMTLLITGLFGTTASLAPSWAWTCTLFAALGFGVGGNLPVDGSVFLEVLPDTHSWLLTMLSVWWPIGQLTSSLAAWYCMTRWPVDEGWRYFIGGTGVVTLAMFALRYWGFSLLESPKYLLSQGRQREAVLSVQGIAYRNGAKTWLTEAVMDAMVDDCNDVVYGLRRRGDGLHEEADAATATMIPEGPRSGPSWHRWFSLTNHIGWLRNDAVRWVRRQVTLDRFRPLFATPILARATTLIWFTWATIGMGYPLFNAFLPQYLAKIHNNTGGGDGGSSARAADDTARAIPPETYRDYAITSAVGVPGSMLAAYLVDHDSAWLGRRGTLALSTLVSALFLFLFAGYSSLIAFTSSGGSSDQDSRSVMTRDDADGKSSSSPTTQLVFSCIEAFSQNIMYGVLYAFTPEIFPAPIRGAGSGVASLLNRVMGLIAPVLAASLPGDGAIYLSGVFIMAAFGGIILIPVETRGAQRL